MDSALPAPNSQVKLDYKPADSAARSSLSRMLAFLMLGGASWILFVALLLLSVPQIVMQTAVRCALQQVSAMILTFVLLFSYPHFVSSYRFAYQQGFAFIGRHGWELLGFPLFILTLLALCVVGWNYPVGNLPLITFVESLLRSVGINLYWSLYSGCGQLLLATLLVTQTIMSGHHYCMQAFGVALACGEENGLRLSARQKQMVKFNLYSLWAMNLFSGYTFFSMLNNRDFVYHPARFPQPLYVASYLAFAVSLAAVFVLVLVPLFKKHKRWPPPLAVVPIVSVWIWLQPFFQPFGYQAWVVPLAHGAQYLFFAYKVEANNFAQIASSSIFKGDWGKALSLTCLFGVTALIGYLGFIYIPVLLDRAKLIEYVTPNFFFLAAFIFISLHHYIIDSVVWRHDSRAKRLLQKALV